MMQELLVSLLFWISSHSMLMYDGNSVPKLAFITEQHLNSMAFGNNHPSAIRAGEYQVSGLYNPKMQTIFLLQSTNIDTASGKALLVHELVHYLQYQNGQNPNGSIAELEPLAYGVEALFNNASQPRNSVLAQ
ncbi:MAG: hypothetical protein JKY89_04230 [Immundisolibacteraceae bacterium]|nr:hypothetical protein [Immundisolibacteraceae bacterium]